MHRLAGHRWQSRKQATLHRACRHATQAWRIRVRTEHGGQQSQPQQWQCSGLAVPGWPQLRRWTVRGRGQGCLQQAEQFSQEPPVLQSCSLDWLEHDSAAVCRAMADFDQAM